MVTKIVMALTTRCKFTKYFYYTMQKRVIFQKKTLFSQGFRLIIQVSNSSTSESPAQQTSTGNQFTQ